MAVIYIEIRGDKVIATYPDGSEIVMATREHLVRMVLGEFED